MKRTPALVASDRFCLVGIRNQRFYRIWYFSLLLFAGTLSSCENRVDEAPVEEIPSPIIPFIDYKVTQTFSHDITLFTEGLTFYKDTLYESTGSPDNLPFTKSLVVRYNLTRNEAKKVVELKDRNYFGEGISFLNDTLYQLTYKNNICYAYIYPTFNKTDSFRFDNKEGWGLTTDGTHLIMSDGTNNLDYKNPGDFTTLKKISVTENGYAVGNMNELEFVKGFIYANVWMTNYVVKIDPSTGNVVGRIDFSRLYTAEQQIQPQIDVLNGIAYNEKNGRFYVTGKLWSHIYEIKLSQ